MYKEGCTRVKFRSCIGCDLCTPARRYKVVTRENCVDEASPASSAVYVSEREGQRSARVYKSINNARGGARERKRGSVTDETREFSGICATGMMCGEWCEGEEG